MIGSGICACGCGQRTTVAKKNHGPSGSVKGLPYKYVHGHSRRKHPHDEPIAHRRRRQRYGLEPGDVEAMLAAQEYECANPACNARLDRSSPIDHDHRTGEIRAMLCHHCNKALGLGRDDPEILRGLAAYLEERAPSIS